MDAPHEGMNAAQVGVPPPPGDVVGVAYAIPILWALPANLTHHSHSLTSHARQFIIALVIPAAARSLTLSPSSTGQTQIPAAQLPDRNDSVRSTPPILPELPWLCPLLLCAQTALIWAVTPASSRHGSRPSVDGMAALCPNQDSTFFAGGVTIAE